MSTYSTPTSPTLNINQRAAVAAAYAAVGKTAPLDPTAWLDAALGEVESPEDVAARLTGNLDATLPSKPAAWSAKAVAEVAQAQANQHAASLLREATEARRRDGRAAADMAAVELAEDFDAAVDVLRQHTDILPDPDPLDPLTAFNAGVNPSDVQACRDAVTAIVTIAALHITPSRPWLDSHLALIVPALDVPHIAQEVRSHGSGPAYNEDKAGPARNARALVEDAHEHDLSTILLRIVRGQYEPIRLRLNATADEARTTMHTLDHAVTLHITGDEDEARRLMAAAS